jgi:hypothetical protein
MKKNYYAIIPASVRYDSSLTPNAKLLYGELTALSNSKGYAFASNSYFAELYETSTRSVSKWISQLNKQGYINVVQTMEKGHTTERKIYIAGINVPDPMEENFHPPTKESSNIILQSNNTINNVSRSRFTPPSVTEIKSYCDHRNNKIDPQHFFDFYSSKGWMIGKNKMKDWKACVRTWERKQITQPQKTDAMERLQDKTWASFIPLETVREI